jgi:hypothetical protein
MQPQKDAHISTYATKHMQKATDSQFALHDKFLVHISTDVKQQCYKLVRSSGEVISQTSKSTLKFAFCYFLSYRKF